MTTRHQKSTIVGTQREWKSYSFSYRWMFARRGIKIEWKISEIEMSGHTCLNLQLRISKFVWSFIVFDRFFIKWKRESSGHDDQNRKIQIGCQPFSKNFFQLKFVFGTINQLYQSVLSLDSEYGYQSGLLKKWSLEVTLGRLKYHYHK